MKAIILSAVARGDAIRRVRAARLKLADTWDRGVRFSHSDKAVVLALLDQVILDLVCDCGVGGGAGLHSMLCAAHDALTFGGAAQ